MSAVPCSVLKKSLQVLKPPWLPLAQLVCSTRWCISPIHCPSVCPWDSLLGWGQGCGCGEGLLDGSKVVAVMRRCCDQLEKSCAAQLLRVCLVI